MIKTEILVLPDEVVQALSNYGLDKEKLIEVAQRAVAAGKDCTPNFPSNAPGTLSYQHGTAALRDLFCGEHWERDRKDGIESIRHKLLGIKVVFQNVDVACDDERLPKSRSSKGKGSERACLGNQTASSSQTALFSHLPHFSPISVQEDECMLYLMVSENGDDVRVEISRPVIKGGVFASFIERIFLVQEGDWEKPKISDDTESAEEDIVIDISRKKS